MRAIDSVKAGESAIVLPPMLQRRLEAAVETFLYPTPGSRIDFSQPYGEPALVSPDSMSWQVFKNPVSLFIGGVAAVILELAEPRVRTGVWNHTTFRSQPLPRLQRTGLAAMMTVYGARSQSEAMIAKVVGMHRNINGVTPAGEPYSATDPELLGWVHSTAGFGFLEAYNAYVRTVGEGDRARFYSEGACSSRLYGAIGAPTSQREIDALFAAKIMRLGSSPTMLEFLDIIQRVPLVPRPAAMMQRWLVKAAVAIVPGTIRARLGLGAEWDLTHWQRRLVRSSGLLADRMMLRSSPAVEACRRLSLPDDYLYFRRGK